MLLVPPVTVLPMLSVAADGNVKVPVPVPVTENVDKASAGVVPCMIRLPATFKLLPRVTTPLPVRFRVRLLISAKPEGRVMAVLPPSTKLDVDVPGKLLAETVKPEAVKPEIPKAEEKSKVEEKPAKKVDFEITNPNDIEIDDKGQLGLF